MSRGARAPGLRTQGRLDVPKGVQTVPNRRRNGPKLCPNRAEMGTNWAHFGHVLARKGSPRVTPRKHYGFPVVGRITGMVGD